MRDDKERLKDIIEAIERIEKHSVKGRKVFEKDELIQNWIVHHLQIIGEATRSLSSRYRDKNSDIPWPKIIGMRNILVHNYFGIDIDAVWSAVENDLPGLKEKIKVCLQVND